MAGIKPSAEVIAKERAEIREVALRTIVVAAILGGESGFGVGEDAAMRYAREALSEIDALYDAAPDADAVRMALGTEMTLGVLVGIAEATIIAPEGGDGS